jgi:hypothetical protein
MIETAHPLAGPNTMDAITAFIDSAFGHGQNGGNKSTVRAQAYVNLCLPQLSSLRLIHADSSTLPCLPCSTI